MKEEKKRKMEKVVNKRKQLGKKSNKKYDNRQKKGPQLPSILQKEIKFFNLKREDESGSDEGEERNDIYEYNEPIAEEETKKNRRFDPVDNLDCELSEDIEDEDLPSDDEVIEDDDDKHTRMLQGITGMPSESLHGKKRKNAVLSEPYPESENDISRNAPDGNVHISIQDLLDPLHGKPGYSKLRKRMQQLERNPMSAQAPLPKVDREKLERKVAYEQSKKDITKWEPLVKRNREAPTIYFDADVDLGFSTVGAIASEFEPRTDFEKKIASLVRDSKVREAHEKDGLRLLELNKISVEDVRDRQNRLAKMRSVLFRHEMKAKHIKKIKSKTFHRMLKRDRLKAASADMQTDAEDAKEYAMKQEFKRAEERMTLKHKNSSKWAKRILKRGLKAQDEGTRAAISEQLHQHSLLTRKMNSMKDNGSSDDSSDEDEDDELSPGLDNEESSKLLTRAKEKTLKVLEEEDDMPKSGVLSLPFMVRGLKRRKEAALEEAQIALQEYDSSLKQLEDVTEAESPKLRTSNGRRVFGVGRKQSEESSSKIEREKNSDSEDFETKENVDLEQERNSAPRKEYQIDPAVLLEESGIGQEPVFKSFDDIIRDPGPKTTYEVSIFASDSRKKMRSEKAVAGNKKNSSFVVEPSLPHQEVKDIDENSDIDSEEEMVDGILSSGTIPDYELPSQADLIHSAFAGDDVEEEFGKDKLEVLNEENPEPEKPVLLPGWGQWTHIQQKKGLPSWMVEEHEIAKRKREDALKKRKDAHLKHVIISEKVDKKAEKLHTTTLPYPYTSKEVFEQSIRVPIGPEYNPATSVGALNRPAVVKKSGIIINPIKFEEVDPHEKTEESTRIRQTPKTKRSKSNGGKSTKKITREKKR